MIEVMARLWLQKIKQWRLFLLVLFCPDPRQTSIPFVEVDGNLKKEENKTIRNKLGNRDAGLFT